MLRRSVGYAGDISTLPSPRVQGPTSRIRAPDREPAPVLALAVSAFLRLGVMRGAEGPEVIQPIGLGRAAGPWPCLDVVDERGPHRASPDGTTMPVSAETGGTELLPMGGLVVGIAGHG